jgi:hypothetical protein
MAALDVDASAEGLAGQIDLELGVPVGGHDVAEAVGTTRRQQRREAFVDRSFGGRPMAVAAVLATGFPAGGFRGGLRGSLGEGRGLAFAGALGLFEQTAEVLDLGFEFSQALA